MFSGILSYIFAFFLCALLPYHAYAQSLSTCVLHSSKLQFSTPSTPSVPNCVLSPITPFAATFLDGSTPTITVPDSLRRPIATITGADSSSRPKTTIPLADSTALQGMTAGALGDSLSSQPESAFSTPIAYAWKDSLVISLIAQKAFLYGGATVKFEDKQLAADYIEFDMAKSVAYATGRKNSKGFMTGLPVFTQGQETFDVKSLSYNFKTKSGVIHDVITEQQESFLHGSVAKRYDSGIVDIKDGKFTTCDAEHPHFYLAISKGRMIPGKKIVAGPSYLVLEDVPLPIGIPFGFLPNTNKRNQSGILLPTWVMRLPEVLILRAAATIWLWEHIWMPELQAIFTPREPGGWV